MSMAQQLYDSLFWIHFLVSAYITLLFLLAFIWVCLEYRRALESTIYVSVCLLNKANPSPLEGDSLDWGWQGAASPIASILIALLSFTTLLGFSHFD